MNMDNCLFYKITEEEITFIILFVDDTLIFRKRQLDIKADSFLGINIGHNEDGTVTLTQPKLLQKLFKEQPDNPASTMPKCRRTHMGRWSLYTTKRKNSPRQF